LWWSVESDSLLARRGDEGLALPQFEESATPPAVNPADETGKRLWSRH
jgi:hypothetical protein